MDWLALLAGVFIGAAGQYFAAKYTDQRRGKEAASAARRRFAEVEAEMPKLIAEIRADLADPELRHVRRVFVLPNDGVMLNLDGPAASYYEDQHDNLPGQFAMLENHGYVLEVSSGNTKQYRLTEEFVRLLRSS